MRVRSPTRLSRSRLGRLASSSSRVGIAAMLQWSGSPRSQPRKARLSSSVSSRSVFARRCSRETATLVGWMTWASMPRARSQRASQKPSRPASKATAMRVIVRPALAASSRQRCEQRSSASSSRLELLQRVALDPGHDAGDEPTRLAHLDDRDDGAVLLEGGEGSAQVVRLRHGALRRLFSAPMLPSPRRPPHSISTRSASGSSRSARSARCSSMPQKTAAGLWRWHFQSGGGPEYCRAPDDGLPCARGEPGTDSRLCPIESMP